MEAIISAASFIVFAFLDLVDFILCFVYRFLDSVLDENPAPCNCWTGGEEVRGIAGDGGGNGGISETLYERKSLFRGVGVLLKKDESAGEMEKKGGRGFPRWSDCGCETCFSSEDCGGEKRRMLYLVSRVTNPVKEVPELSQNVIFLHGFLSSSSIWLESVFPNLSEESNNKIKLFAVDLLGFGRSPKPTNCFYTIADHLEMIDTSVIKRFRLNSFHIVAHSMGCILALALAAKFPNSVKSITLVAPPYFSSSEDKSSCNVLNRIAERKIWPPLLFGSSVMSWYEHLGRTACFILCKNHSKWEWIIKLITWRRQLPFTVIDFTKHTHHSAWHTMHNVICGGAKLVDKYLEILTGEDIPMKIIQGSKDQVVPLDCSLNLKARVPRAELQIVYAANHSTVILGRKKDFSRDIQLFWSLSTQTAKH